MPQFIDHYNLHSPTIQGLIVSSILITASLSSLAAGPLADKFSRKYTIVLAVVVFSVGVIVQTAAKGPDSIYGGACTILLHSRAHRRDFFAGRFVTGLGVGSLSMCVPLYNAEYSPPELRGSLVALQQLSITFGIMISYWIDYGMKCVI